MDYTELGANSCNEIIDATDTDIAAKAEALVAHPIEDEVRPPVLNLHALRDLIENEQAKITAATLVMQAAIAKAQESVRPTKLKAFLASECGMSRSDLPTYLKFERTLGQHRQQVLKARLPFSVLKALVAAPQSARSIALERMAAGSVMQTTDITAIKRDIAHERLSPRQRELNERTKALAVAARKRAKSALEGFGADIATSVDTLIDIFEAGNDGRLSDFGFSRKLATHVQRRASEYLGRFEALFDVASLPQSWEYEYHVHEDEQVSLARAHAALKRLADGEFQAWDDTRHVPFDTRHDFLDVDIVKSLAWLAGGTRTVTRPKPKRQAAVAATPKFSRPPRRLKSLEICAGAGGQALGLHMAGFDAVGLWERNEHAAKTLSSNYPLGPVHCSDVRDIDFSHYRDKVDLVAGGVPCQPHSAMGLQRGREDERDLFLEAVRIVDQVNPRAFFFENVEGFGQRGAADYRADLHGRFAALGYESRLVSFYGCNFGLAQKRPRVALVGFRDQMMHRFTKPPVLTETHVTVGEALLDIVASNGWPHAETWAREKANRIGKTIVGGSEMSSRLSFTANVHRQAWADMQIDAMELAAFPPSATHGKDQLFKFTLAMGARLQGFPDHWEFKAGPSKRKSKSTKIYTLGERPYATKQKKMQIANALPPVMAQAMGLAIYSALTGVEFDFPAALSRPYPMRPKPMATEAELIAKGILNLSALQSRPDPFALPHEDLEHDLFDET